MTSSKPLWATQAARSSTDPGTAKWNASWMAMRPSSGSDVEIAVAFGHRRPPERHHPGEHAVTETQARHLGEDPLRSPDHPAGPDVIGRLVPGAHQAAALVDTAARQVSAEVAASAGGPRDSPPPRPPRATPPPPHPSPPAT